MARLWDLKIINSGGAVTLADVPQRWRAEVARLLDQAALAP